MHITIKSFFVENCCLRVYILRNSLIMKLLTCGQHVVSSWQLAVYICLHFSPSSSSSVTTTSKRFPVFRPSALFLISGLLILAARPRCLGLRSGPVPEASAYSPLLFLCSSLWSLSGAFMRLLALMPRSTPSRGFVKRVYIILCRRNRASTPVVVGVGSVILVKKS